MRAHTGITTTGWPNSCAPSSRVEWQLQNAVELIYITSTCGLGLDLYFGTHMSCLCCCGVLCRAVPCCDLQHLRLDQENIGEVQREAKTMAKLRGHPNILRLHAVAFAGPKGAETDGFFLLDYCVSAVTLSAARARGKG